jgi:hypothetical protein
MWRDMGWDAGLGTWIGTLGRFDGHGHGRLDSLGSGFASLLFLAKQVKV